MRKSKDDNKKDKDVIDLMLDQLNFHGMAKDELIGKDGLLRQHIAGGIHDARLTGLVQSA